MILRQLQSNEVFPQTFYQMLNKHFEARFPGAFKLTGTTQLMLNVRSVGTSITLNIESCSTKSDDSWGKMQWLNNGVTSHHHPGRLPLLIKADLYHFRWQLCQIACHFAYIAKNKWLIPTTLAQPPHLWHYSSLFAAIEMCLFGLHWYCKSCYCFGICVQIYLFGYCS